MAGVVFTLALGAVSPPPASAAPFAGVKINFQPASAPVPSGYTPDTGAAFSDTAGFGWVTQESLSTNSHSPLDLTANTRDRNIVSDQRLDTLIHMQYPTSIVNQTIRVPGAWEYAVANGSYTVTVAVGDAGDYFDDKHQINVEGTAVITRFAPTAANHFMTKTATVKVSDGRLTVDAIGGENTKLDYVEIAPADDGGPPAAPTGVTATAGDRHVRLSWNANSEPDLAGYNVFRSTTSPVPTTGTPLNGAALLSVPGFIDLAVSNGTTYYYLVQAVDQSGNKADANAVQATPQASAAALPLPLNVNFQSEAAAVPTGYLRDFGEAYGARSGTNQGTGLSYGWVVPGTTSGRSLVGNGRDRDLVSDQRLDTLMHMQYMGSNGVAQPGSWEIGLLNGTYSVTISVGDAAFTDGTHTIAVEGVKAIDAFTPTDAKHFATGSVSVTVRDGRLTLDANGGTNTKIDYVEITAPDTTPPAAPAGVVATPLDGTVQLKWNANTEPDLAGYNVFRSTSLPVSTAGTPLNASLIKSTSYTDNGLTNGTTYYYVVQSVDTSGNKANANAVSAVPTAGFSLPLKVNFQSEAAPVPTGYVRDFGEGFGARTGANQGTGLNYGWVAPGTTTPRSLVGNGRDRDVLSDQRLDTLMHMQYTGGSGIAQPGSWEIAVPNGSYSVTVSVGDAAFTDGSHTVTVEGVKAINGFVPSDVKHFASATVTATVNDGRLTLDASGGTNTKINYVEVAAPDTTPPPPPSGFTNVSWSRVANGPTLRIEGGSAVVDGKLYAFGGYVDTTFVPTPRLDVYDPATNTWTRLADMAEPTTHMGVAVDDHDIYVAGGYPANADRTGQLFATTGVWKYNVDTNAWTAMPSLPQARGAGALVLSGRTLHFFGGSDASLNDRADHWTLSLDGGGWTAAAPLPLARNHLGGAAINGRVYAVGGQTGENEKAVYSDRLDMWDPLSGSWKSMAPLPSPRSHISAATFVMDGRIISIGGETSFLVPTTSAIAYDPAANAWVQLTPLPAGRNSGVAGNTNGTIYYSGGWDGANYVVDTFKGVPGSGSPTPSSNALAINFQNDAAAVPAGYIRDFGQAYGARTSADQGSGLSYGWVQPGTTTPLSLVGNGRERNVVPDQRLDTLIHMQYTGSSGVAQPGSWEIAVANGNYSVTAAVGDPSFVDGSHTINAEGTNLISNFMPTRAAPVQVATKIVTVSDGRLTIDPSGGTNTKLNYVDIVAATATRPRVTATTPAMGATNILRDAPVSAEVRMPNVGSGVDPATLTASTVRLVRISDNVQIAANVNTSGGGDVIVLQPKSTLDPDTTYRFDVTSGVKDVSGASFLPYSTSFTTGTAVGANSTSGASFEQVALPTATDQSFTSLVFGPDNKLYASTIDGLIYRFTVATDGTLGTPQILDSLQQANGGPRMLIGLAFDPAATASNLILWVTHSEFAFSGGTDWTGKVSRLSGADLGTVQDYVVGLPRSVSNHVTNGAAFGPDGALYVLQGSNTAMGAPDDTWGMRPERLLNAAVLRINTKAITSPPLNVKTEDGGTYDPFAAGAPLTLYATGVRNAYDLVWHSNGRLYVPTNGSAAGGNAPATPATLPAACGNRIDSGTNGAYTGPSVPALTNVTTAQSDFLFRVVQGGYYGHPNPARCEWVLNGGNPTSGADPAEVAQYPVSTAPDRNWRRAAFDFGLHYSPDGIIEYKSNALNGVLRGKLFVARYSGGDDIIVLTPGGPNLDITSAEAGIPGLKGFSDPVDLAESPTGNGNLYVSELGAQKITLLRPLAASKNGKLALENRDGVPYDDRLVFSRIGSFTNPPSFGVHDRAILRVKNTGTDALTLTALTVTGPWQLVSPPTLPASIAAGAFVDLQIQFTASSGKVWNGTLTIESNDPTTPSKAVALSGLWEPDVDGSAEPSLQNLLDIFGYKTVVTGPGQVLNQQGLVRGVGDEVVSPYWTRADSTKPVTVRQLSAFHTYNYVATLNWFARGGSQLNAIVSHAGEDSSTLLPRVPGLTGPAAGSFSPGGAFGFSVDGLESSDPTKNDQSTDRSHGCPGPCGHHVRVWKLRDRAGAIVPNTYLLTLDYSGFNYDYNDNLYLITNLVPATNGQALYRLDVAGSANYTDSNGDVWSPDTGLFTPSTAIAEGADFANQTISNTSDQPIYRTYRAFLGDMPVEQRILTYNLTLSGVTRVNVRLHYAERFFDAAGSRVFNVDVEGQRVSTNFDIFKFAPGQDSAMVVALNHVNVADGTLTIKFSAVTNYAAINGIEVFADP